MDQVKKNIWPALTLMLMAPMLTEVLPGATRFSSMFVLPIEMCVWGGGAVLIRYAVRRWQLGWLNMLLLAIALAIAEECLIQQTSLAPLVIRLKGITYARAFGVNYVYLLWALVYEPVFVVLLPVALVELIFPSRREGLWISKAGVIIYMILFVLGSYLAWFSWTQIARPKVFHMPVYRPPVAAIITAVAVIAALIFMALGPGKNKLAVKSAPAALPAPWLIGVAGAVWATLWFGMVLLGFGIAPYFPPYLAILGGLIIVLLILIFIPRWAANPRWGSTQIYALLFGTMLGSMAVSFVGFIGSGGIDLYFKIIVNIIAVILLTVLGLNISKRPVQIAD